MSDARERILRKVAAHTSGPARSPDAIRAEASALIGDPAGIQPSFPQLGTVEKFIERATSERLTASVDEIGDWSDAPAAVSRYLAGADLAASLALQPSDRLGALDWSGIEIRHEIGMNEPVAVSAADFAIAETGTLVFRSSPEAPTLFSFLPLHHIALVERGRIVRYMEDFWREQSDESQTNPRSINFVTGTSGTADIEAVNIRGAHGPRYLHIIIVGDATDDGRS